MYAVHKGKYTTLCMFWTARDIFVKRLYDGHIEEATKIYQALQRVLPNLEDTDGRAAAFMDFAASRLADHKAISDLSAKGEPNQSLDQPRAENHGSSLTNDLDSKVEDEVNNPDPQDINSCNSCNSWSEEKENICGISDICVPEKFSRLLEILDLPLSVRQMMALLGFHSRDKFLANYLTPAIKAGLIEMTHPNSPTSPAQRYRRTGKDIGAK